MVDKGILGESSRVILLIIVEASRGTVTELAQIARCIASMMQAAHAQQCCDYASGYSCISTCQRQTHEQCCCLEGSSPVTDSIVTYLNWKYMTSICWSIFRAIARLSLKSSKRQVD